MPANYKKIASPLKKRPQKFRATHYFLSERLLLLKGLLEENEQSDQSKANIVSALIQSTFCYMRVEIKILSSFFPTYVFCICPSMFDRNYLQLTKERTVSAESSLQFSASKVLVLARNIPAWLFLVFSSSFFPHSVIQMA